MSSIGIEAALSGQEREGLFRNYADLPVIGVYRWMPDLELALVAEQPQEKAFAATDNVTAATVGATLLVALATAIIAAVVTRQVTQPVVQLTESALSIAEGDLDQQVPVTSRDEIGILAFVFNRMASELKELYSDLEAKVAEQQFPDATSDLGRPQDVAQTGYLPTQPLHVAAGLGEPAQRYLDPPERFSCLPLQGARFDQALVDHLHASARLPVQPDDGDKDHQKTERYQEFHPLPPPSPSIRIPSSCSSMRRSWIALPTAPVSGCR